MNRVELPSDCIGTATELSVVAGRFLELVAREPTLLRRQTFSMLDDLPLKDPVQGWPLFAGPDFTAALSLGATRVFDLVRHVPLRAFAGAPAALGAYFGARDPDAIVRALLLTRDAEDAIARGDFIATEGGMQCLELNVSGALGGWDIFVAAQALLAVPPISAFLAAEGIGVQAPNPMLSFLCHAARVGAARSPHGSEVNLAILYPDHDPPPPDDPSLLLLDFVAGMYADALRAVDPDLRGRVALLGTADVTFDVRGPRAKGDAFTTFLDLSLVGSNPDFVATSAAIQASGRGYVFNGPASEVLSDKRTLALLWEQAELGRLSEEDARDLERYVPWTRRMLPGIVAYEGQACHVFDLVAKRREEFVLKKGLSWSGDHVIVGFASTEAEWDHAVRDALAEGDWVAQKVCISKPYALQYGDLGWAPHRVIWGPFLLGGQYANSFARVLPMAASPIVNAARGSSDCVVVEVDERA